MKITKYEHGCFTVEIDDQVLVVDPGNITDDFIVTNTIIGVVITHEHGDHFDPDKLAAIYDKNPDSILISLPEITTKMPDHQSTIATVGQSMHVGPFKLDFFGGHHAIIHPDIPVINNFGVLINDDLYYPGDSFALPNKVVKALALPISAPWMKMSEAIDFLLKVKPELAFPTHDAILSTSGKTIADNLASRFARSINTIYTRIDGTTIDI